MQVCARGSVNCNGIKLDDVWYVPGVTVNMVAGAHFSNQEISLTLDRSAFSLKRPDGTVVGKGRVKGNLYEVDFLDISRYSYLTKCFTLLCFLALLSYPGTLLVY